MLNLTIVNNAILLTYLHRWPLIIVSWVKFDQRHNIALLSAPLTSYLLLYQYKSQIWPKTQYYDSVCTVEPLSHTLSLQESNLTQNAILLPYQQRWHLFIYFILTRVKFGQKYNITAISASLITYPMFYHDKSQIGPKTQYFSHICTVDSLSHALSLKSHSTQNITLLFYLFCWPLIPCSIVTRVKLDYECNMTAISAPLNPYDMLYRYKIQIRPKIQYCWHICIADILSHAFSLQESNWTKNCNITAICAPLTTYPMLYRYKSQIRRNYWHICTVYPLSHALQI